MSRPYTAISEQNTYDVTVQKFGGLDDIDEVMRQIPDLNNIIPLGTNMVFSDTEDVLARRFDSNRTLFSTGMPIPPKGRAYSNDYSDDYGVWGDPTLDPILGNTEFPYTFPYNLS
jgi:hypothetical protein